MSKIPSTYTTKLETSNIDLISAVLDAKLDSTSPQSVADYIALAVDNLEARVARMKEAKKELDSLIKEDENQIEVIKIGASSWITECGIDKLDGDRVSSITTYKPKPATVLKVVNEESLINQGYFKTVLDKTMVKNLIESGEEVEGAELEIIHKEDLIKINKRKSIAS